MPKLSKEDVILKLMELGVEYDSKASYNDLLATLKAVEQEDDKALEKGIKGEKVPSPEIVSTDKETNDEVKEAIDKVETELPKEEPKEEKKNPFFSFETKTPLTGKAHEMRKKLMSQPTIPVFIPLGAEEKIGSTQQVTLNGYPIFIRKGQQVDVPRQVYEVLQEKFQHQMNVRQHPYLVTGGPQNIELQSFD